MSSGENTRVDAAVAAVERGRPAVVAADAALTYGELLDRADALAAQLRSAGVVEGQPVAVCLPRSAALVVACLAVLRAGAGYVAVDPHQPETRMRAVLDDSGARVLLTADAAAVGAAAPGALPVALVTLSPPAVAEPVAGLAYVMFTSGSTGRPKGVLVGHAGLRNLARWHGRAFEVAPGVRCSQLAGPGFDAAAWEIWGCLSNGGTLVVAPEEVKTDPAGLRDFLLAERITVAFVPTPVATLLLALDWPADAALRRVLTGGDRLSRRPAPGLPFVLVNNYGVTEATVVSTSAAVLPGEGAPSIGAAVDGVELRVVDGALADVPVGEPGELLVGGVSVALGYAGSAELTAAAFVTAPDGTGPWYRTGDLVRQRPDGEFDYVARADDQVQVRGNRVEPGEVSTVLLQHPGVAAGVVLAAGTTQDPELVGFWVPGAAAPDEAGLRAHVAAALPPHMVPARFVAVPELPLTGNGKVDRDALLATSAPAAPEAEELDVDVETAVAGIVAAVLKIPAIEPDDNFLLLGGHSLLGAQVVARLADRYQVEISLRDLFDNPTPRGMAQLVTDALLDQVLALDDATVAALLADDARADR